MTWSALWRPLLGSMIVLLVASEWLLRVRHRQSSMRMPAEGLRDDAQNVDPETLAGHFRIVALGDSITHGMALRREQTFPDILSKLLEPHCERPVAVVNAGVAGQTAIQGLGRLWRDVIRFRPHMTLVSFGLNDANLRCRRQDVYRERDLLPVGGLALMNRLHLFRTCRARMRQIGLSLGLSRPLDYDAAPWDEPRASPRAYRLALEQIVKQVRRHSGGDVWLLTTHPVRQRNTSSARDERQVDVLRQYNDIVRAVASGLGAGLIDIEQDFTQKNLTDVLQADGVHLTEAGQQHLAETIHERLSGQVSFRK